MRNIGPTYHGWVIVAAAFAVTACLGEVLWSFGVFFKALEAEFGWSRGLTSTGYTFLAVGYGLSSITFGRLADRYPPRHVLTATALISGTAIALCGRIESIIQLQGLLFATGLGAGSLIPVPTSTVGRWFESRPRGGIALGVTMAGVGVGALLFAPLFNQLILAFGWRTTFVVAGAIFFTIVSTASIAMKPSPVSYTLVHPDRSHVSSAGAPKPSTRSLLRAPQFLQMVAIMVVTTFAFQVLTVHLVPYSVDVGISQTAAAAALGLAGGFSVPGRIGSGLLSDRFGWGTTLVLSQAGMALAILVLPLVRHESVLIAVVGLFGFCHGVRAVSVIGVLGRVFGMRPVGQLVGIMIAIAHIAGASGPYLAGFLFDKVGSYTVTFLPLGALILVGAILSLRLDVDHPPATSSTPH